ncbi:tripartite tricarboxylate transporter TctB family protein [Arthrobacter sp. TmT3-37]
MPMKSSSTAVGSARRTSPRSVLIGQIVLAVLGAYVVVTSLDLGLWTSLGPGPGLFPFAMGALLVLLSVIWFFQERREATETAEPVDRRLVIAVVLSLLILASVMNLLGFQVSMFLFLLYHLRIRSHRTWPSSLIISLAGSVGVFYAFYYGLNVALPTALLLPLTLIGL